MDNINISNELESSISEFSSQMTEMSALLDDIKTTTTNTKEFWTGDDSDAILASIENFMKSFDVVVAQNEVYSAFLKDVLETYKDKDSKISADIDSRGD